MKDLSKDAIERYSRHIVMPEIGLEGQEKLNRAAVLVVGVGGLGSAQAIYLAAAGVGRIGLIDDDQVALSNLQRQVIYRNKDVGRKKIEAAREHMKELNPYVEIDSYDTLLVSDNAMDICAPYDIILDGSDNFGTRYLINDVSILQNKPNVYGSIHRFEGQISVFGIPGEPCYRCLYPYPPAPGEIESCAVGGVFGALPGIVGSLQVIETIKLITGQGMNLSGRLLLIDTLKMKYDEIKIDRNEQCPVCGDNPVITAPINYDEFCGLDEDTKFIEEADRHGISPESLNQALRDGENIKLIDIREQTETRICRIDKAENFPAGRYEELFTYIKDDDQVVLYCRSGIRSARLVNQLKTRGNKNTRHLIGGILAWIECIDPEQPKY